MTMSEDHVTVETKILTHKEILHNMFLYCAVNAIALPKTAHKAECCLKAMKAAMEYFQKMEEGIASYDEYKKRDILFALEEAVNAYKSVSYTHLTLPTNREV